MSNNGRRPLRRYRITCRFFSGSTGDFVVFGVDEADAVRQFRILCRSVWIESMRVELVQD